MSSFKFPRRPGVRPRSEPLERDEYVAPPEPVVNPVRRTFAATPAEAVPPVSVNLSDDDYPAYSDDTGPLAPTRADLEAPVRVYTRKI